MSADEIREALALTAEEWSDLALICDEYLHATRPVAHLEGVERRRELAARIRVAAECIPAPESGF